MGSTGWVRCYWCEQWVYNAYIVDGIDNPLCDPCMDGLMDGIIDEPRRPNAICHRTNAIKLLLRWQVPDVVWRHIASFLEDRYRPGAGSRSTPAS